MIGHITRIEFKKISRISPSQFFLMKNCPYKSLLAEAFNKKPLLPISANAYFGTVLHKILELITKGGIKSDIEFDKSFGFELLKMEDAIEKGGYGSFLPLQKNVKDFGMKKILLKKYLRHHSERPKQTSILNFYPERWLESRDGLIGGRVDLIIERDGESELVDFKTGKVTQDFLDDEGESFLDVKQEYQEQLKLYAYLYYENTGKFPTRLSIIDLAKQKFNVPFTLNDCICIYNEAKELLIETNKCIETGDFIAHPSQLNCRYCLYRPACAFFLDYIKNQSSFNDVSGFFYDAKQYKNGNVTLFLKEGETIFTITSFSKDMLEKFREIRGNYISIFNLKRENTEFIYSAIKTTMIYEQ